METTIRYDYACIKEEENAKIPETMWYQRKNGRTNFEFLNIGQLTPLKEKHNTIISVKNYINRCRILYTNSNRSFAERCKNVEADIREEMISAVAKEHKGNKKYAEKYALSDEFQKNLKEKVDNTTYKMFKKIYDSDESLQNIYHHLYCKRIEKAINEGKPLNEQRMVVFSFVPASLGFDVDCFKIDALSVFRG